VEYGKVVQRDLNASSTGVANVAVAVGKWTCASLPFLLAIFDCISAAQYMIGNLELE
jgi:hypothetical protein